MEDLPVLNFQVVDTYVSISLSIIENGLLEVLKLQCNLALAFFLFYWHCNVFENRLNSSKQYKTNYFHLPKFLLHFAKHEYFECRVSNVGKIYLKKKKNFIVWYHKYSNLWSFPVLFDTEFSSVPFFFLSLKYCCVHYTWDITVFLFF